MNIILYILDELPVSLSEYSFIKLKFFKKLEEEKFLENKKSNKQPQTIINRFMDLFYDNQAHILWSFRGGSEGKMRFITPSDFYNAFGDCSDSEIEAAIEFYQNKKRKR